MHPQATRTQGAANPDDPKAKDVVPNMRASAKLARKAMKMRFGGDSIEEDEAANDEDDEIGEFGGLRRKEWNSLESACLLVWGPYVRLGLTCHRRPRGRPS